MFHAPLPQKLEKLSTALRLELLDMVAQNGGHIGGSLSSLDILIALYFGNIFSFPKKYNFKGDSFILSAGHLCPALYTVLASYGAFSKAELSTYTHLDSPLQGHSSTEVPGVLYSAGALGQGLSFSVGLALASPKKSVVCLTSDGEHQEGQTWEAIMSANKFGLKNLINIVDRNNYQIDGSTEDIMPLEDLGSKYLSFGWQVYEIDGHSYLELLKTLVKIKKKPLAPTCIIAHTILGKGVSYMHHDYHFHDVKNLTTDQLQRAQSELSNL